MSARTNSTSNISTKANQVSLPQWIGTIGVALFLLIFPYDRGLFNGYEFGFESAIYAAVIFGLVLLLVAAASLFSKWQLDGYRSILSIAVLVLPFIYWISSFQAVSGYYASFMTFIWFLLAALFISGLYFADAIMNRKVIEYALMLSSYIIVLFGLLNLFGQTYYRDALWLAHDGYRLASVFQYSNTYAGFLAALFLVTLYYAVHCIRPSARLMHAAMLVPIWISFMFTYSRGAIVVIPVMVLILMPFLRITKQIAYIVFLGLSVLVSMAILGKLTTNADQIAAIVQPTETKVQTPISLFSSLPLQSWGLLLLGMVITAGLIMLYHAKAAGFIDKKLEKLSNHKWSFAAMPVVIILLTAAAVASLLGSSAIRGLLPDKIASRFENINLQQHSVLERLTFYKDGLRVAEDYPLLGGGGGAWQVIYEQYQNNPYWSRQAHSFFVQVLVEVGWIGLIALVLFLALAYFLYIRAFIRNPERRGSHIIFFIMSLTLLIHAAIDFDMSYVYISSIVFLSLGCMIAPFSDKLTIARLNRSDAPSWPRITYSSALALIAIILLIATVRETSANKQFNETYASAMQGQASLNELLERLDDTIDKSPKHSAFTLTKASWLDQGHTQTGNTSMLELALDTLEQAKEHDSYNRSIIMTQYLLLQKNNQLTESFDIIEEGVSKFPWDIEMYNAAVTSYSTAHKAALSSGDTEAADKYQTRILALIDEVQRRMDQLAALPEEQQQGREFSFTEAMKQAVAELAASGAAQ